MASKQVKVRLKKDVTTEDFWRATYYSDSNYGIRLIPNFDDMKKEYLDGKLSRLGSLEVAVPISYYNRETESIDDDLIEYDYIKESKNIWEIIEL